MTQSGLTLQHRREDRWDRLETKVYWNGFHVGTIHRTPSTLDKLGSFEYRDIEGVLQRSFTFLNNLVQYINDYYNPPGKLQKETGHCVD